jgi:phosphate transport system permease protein
MLGRKKLQSIQDRGPLALGKKLRFFERIIEFLIRALSFISIAAIALIFIFVFREASPLFFGSKSSESATVHTSKVYRPSEQKNIASSEASGETAASASKSTPGIPKTANVETKVDEKGNVQKITRNGGKVEQEVFDPLADDEPAAPKKPVEKKESSIPKEKPKPQTVKQEPKPAGSKSTTTNSGKVEQEVYDPLAEEQGTPIASIPGQKSTEVKQSGSATEEPAKVDSAALHAQQIGADSAEAKEERNATASKESANFIKMLTGDTWQPVSEVPKYGFVPLFIGTLKVTIMALLFAGPIAILAALFTSSFAPKWARETIKPVIELLAGFPSVVIGFFALIVMASLFQNIFHYTFRLNAFVGGVAMAFAVIPIIYTISEDALTAVPQPLRDASTALGATRWQTAFKIVLPAALPGVFAAIILGFGRAFGETMIALMATGNAPLTSANFLEPIRTFSATIGAEMAEVVFGDEHYRVLFLIGSMLFVFTFTMNSLVEFYIRKRLIKRIQGK